MPGCAFTLSMNLWAYSQPESFAEAYNPEAVVNALLEYAAKAVFSFYYEGPGALICRGKRCRKPGEAPRL